MSPNEFREWIANFLFQASFWGVMLWQQFPLPLWAYILIGLVMFFFLFPVVPIMIIDRSPNESVKTK